MPGWRIGFAAGNRAADRGADADQVLSRLWRLHADPGGGHRGAQRPAGLRRGGARALPRAARRAGRRPGQGRLADARARRPRCSAGRRCPSRFEALGSLGFAKLLLEEADVAVSPGHRLRRVWRGLSCGWLWSRTGTGCGRRCAASAAFLQRATATARRRRDPCARGLSMAAPLRIGIAGLGTVGAGTLPAAARQRRAARQPHRPAPRGHRRQRPRSRAGDRGLDLGGRALARRRAGPGRRPRGRPRLRADRRQRRRGAGADPGRARRGKPVVTANKAMLAHARRRAGAGCRGGGRAARASRPRSRAASRSSSRCARGWRPTASGASTASSTAPATIILTHDARDRPRLRRRAGRGAGAGLRRGRPEPSTSTASTPPTSWRCWPSLAFGGRPRFDAIHVEGIRHVSARSTSRSPTELGYRIKLLGVARMTLGRAGAAGASLHGAGRRTRSRQVEGVFNGVVVEGDRRRRGGSRGPRRRRRPDRLGGRSPTSSTSPAGSRVPAFGVPAQRLARPSDRADGGARGQLLHPPAWWSTSRASWPTSRPCCATTRSRSKSLIQRGRNPGQAVPIVLTSHDTTEARMRGALDRIAALPTRARAAADDPHREAVIASDRRGRR